MNLSTSLSRRTLLWIVGITSSRSFTLSRSFNPGDYSVHSSRSANPFHRFLFGSVIRHASTTSNQDRCAMAESVPEKMMVVDPFCFRQFHEYSDTLGKDYTGTVLNISIAEFEAIVNQRFLATNQSLTDGYAPFCKHLFVTNDFTNALVNVLPITADNEHLLRSKYVARTADELPVLTRYFPQELLTTTQLELPKAQYLDIILYSREQIRLENAAKPSSFKSDFDHDTDDIPWGIVSIEAQDINRELPMNPITQMRNALGKAEGGSGIPLDRAAYLESVVYWKDHAVVS